jgi:hypothetical protein
MPVAWLETNGDDEQVRHARHARLFRATMIHVNDASHLQVGRTEQAYQKGSEPQTFIIEIGRLTVSYWI